MEGGARLVYGGKRPADPRLANGYFVEPTVFADVTDDMRIAREEIFGPVVSILRWSDEDDVVARVNALDYGLTASIWTHDLDRAHRLASRVEAGYIWINGASTHHVGVPFGGVQAVGHRPRGVDRGAPRLHADQERQRHVAPATAAMNQDNRQEDIMLIRQTKVVCLRDHVRSSRPVRHVQRGHGGKHRRRQLRRRRRTACRSPSRSPRATSRRRAPTSPASSRRRAAARRCATRWRGVAYGEANPGAIAVAIQQGADIKIVSDNVLTIAEFAWMVKKDSPIKTIKDLKGKKIGYTNPRSTSQALAILLLQKAGYKEEDAELVKTGGFGPMARGARPRPDRRRAVTEPLWSKVEGQVSAC